MGVGVPSRRRRRLRWKVGVGFLGPFPLRTILLVPSAKQPINEIFQISPNDLFHQIAFRPVDGTAHLKIHRGVTWLVNRLKIVADRTEQLGSHFIINREL